MVVEMFQANKLTKPTFASSLNHYTLNIILWFQMADVVVGDTAAAADDGAEEGERFVTHCSLIINHRFA